MSDRCFLLDKSKELLEIFKETTPEKYVIWVPELKV